ncbi:MAG: DegT/DnrJ/EryC1/StrS family aminotransferase [Anditalea sp.]
MKKYIPFLELGTLHQQIADELKEKFLEVLGEGIFSAGKEVAMFEKKVGNLLKVSYAIPCSNGTDALELALTALEIGPGDEVIVPALTWTSTAEAVVNVGAKPIFCDVDQDGLIAVSEAEKLVTTRTKGMIPVHLYGKMVDMKRLLNFAHQHQLRVIEDGAQAFGAFQQGISAGAFGDIGCFSFYPTKNLGALGEAGLLTTKEEILAKRLRFILNHGQSERNVHELVGRNSKIDTLQAAFLNVKLRHFDTWQNIRKRWASHYLKELQEVKAFHLPHDILNADHNAHLFTIRFNQRDTLKDYLEKQGIGTAVHYPASLPKTKAFYSLSSFPVAEEIARTTLSLPLHPLLKEEELMLICGKIKDFFRLQSS